MEFSKITQKYWQEKDWQDLEKVQSVDDLFSVAEKIIGRMDKPFVQVCGPIATGGLGSVEENLNVFNDAIKKLQKEGLNVFDQIPFEIPMQVLKKKFTPEKIGKDILNNFYLPIFNSGFVSTFYFLPTWQTSLGSKWEHEEALKKGIKIVYL
ncbi:MAG: hypothetical protein WCX46_04505 [Candidatus Paceibacterota bacterium]